MVERSVQSSGPTRVNRRRIKRDAPFFVVVVVVVLFLSLLFFFFFPFLVNFPRALLTILLQEFISWGQRKEDVSRKKTNKQTKRGWGRGESPLPLFLLIFFSLSPFVPHSTI